MSSLESDNPQDDDNSEPGRLGNVSSTASTNSITIGQVVATIAILMLGYVVIAPTFESWHLGKFQRVTYTMRVTERIVESLIALWIFVLGACIGSFLNVVVYRTPRGLPITGSSFCPSCKTPIRWYDNIPIFGWLNLKGACRSCQQPISSRYPVVEFTVGLIFLVLAVFEIGQGGTNLPSYARSRSGFTTNLLDNPLPLAVIFGCHAAWMAVLVSQTLIVRDGQRLPKRLAIVVGAAIGICAALFPQLHWLDAGNTSAFLSFTGRLLPVLISGFAGLFAGVVVLIARQTPGVCYRHVGYENDAILWGCGLAGVTLGWQSLPIFLALLFYVELASYARNKLTGVRSPNVASVIATVSFLFLLGWRYLAPYAIPGSVWRTLLMALSLATACGILMGQRRSHA